MGRAQRQILTRRKAWVPPVTPSIRPGQGWVGPGIVAEITAGTEGSGWGR